MPSSPTVLTIGSATRDVFLFSKAFKVMPMPGKRDEMAGCVTLGAKLDVDDIVHSTGGGATNAAVTFARLGFTTSVIARIGNDESGRAILADLESRKIDTKHIVTSKTESTGYSTLLTAENGERTILIYRGASAQFTEKDIRVTKITASAVYLTSLGGNVPLALSIAKACKQKGALFFWNPGESELKTGRGLDPIRKLARVLLLNLEEAQLLSGKSVRDPKALCELLALPGTITVITDGNNGAYANEGKATWHCRTQNVPSISRTGAGDAFGSAFCAAILRNMSVEDALRLGTMNAEGVVQKIGAKAGILPAWPAPSALAQYRVRKL